MSCALTRTLWSRVAKIALDAGRDEFQRELFIRSSVGIQEFNAREKLVTHTWADAWGGAASLDAKNRDTTWGMALSSTSIVAAAMECESNLLPKFMLQTYVLYGRKSE